MCHHYGGTCHSPLLQQVWKHNTTFINQLVHSTFLISVRQPNKFVTKTSWARLQERESRTKHENKLIKNGKRNKPRENLLSTIYFLLWLRLCTKEKAVIIIFQSWRSARILLNFFLCVGVWNFSHFLKKCYLVAQYWKIVKKQETQSLERDENIF